MVDAVREMAQALSETKAENGRAVTKVKPKSKDGQVAGIAGVGVGAVTETIDFLFFQAWGHDRSVMEFLDLSLIDGGITAVITGVLTFLARKVK